MLENYKCFLKANNLRQNSSNTFIFCSHIFYQTRLFQTSHSNVIKFFIKGFHKIQACKCQCLSMGEGGENKQILNTPWIKHLLIILLHYQLRSIFGYGPNYQLGCLQSRESSSLIICYSYREKIICIINDKAKSNPEELHNIFLTLKKKISNNINQEL